MKQKSDYHLQLKQIISSLSNSNKPKPTLLLHACCGPCSSYVIEYLSSFFDITIFFYNPNIHPLEEYTRRLEELKKFLTDFPIAIQNNVKLIEMEYNPEDFFEFTNVRNEQSLQTEPERGERCRRCYLQRMSKAFSYAVKNSFNYFTTTLSISPYKDSEKINTIGTNLVSSFISTNSSNLSSTCTTNFLPADFKKNNGFLRSLQLSKEYGLYRQDYCGCIYSKLNNNHSS